MPNTLTAEETDYSFKSRVTGEKEFQFSMEGMMATVRNRIHDDPPNLEIDVDRKPDHIDVEINVGESIVVTGNVHALAVHRNNEGTMVAHIYNLHDWDELTQENMAVGMAYDGTWMSGENNNAVQLTGRETW